MRRLLAVATVVVMAATAVPVVGATGWKVKANLASKGAGFLDTSVMASVVVHKPYAVRIGFAAAKGTQVTVRYDYDAWCENRSKSASGRSLTTRGDGAMRFVTLYSGSNNLGAYCDVAVYAELRSTALLKTRIDAQHR